MIGGKRVVAAAIKYKGKVIVGVSHFDEHMRRQFKDIFGRELHAYIPELETGYLKNDRTDSVETIFTHEREGIEILHGEVPATSTRKIDREFRRKLSAFELYYGSEAGKHVTRFVVCAANRFGDFIVPGYRHFCPVMRDMMDAMPEDHIVNKVKCKRQDQGFLDSQGVFLTREEAYALALENGQITLETKVSPTEGKLFSEDLY